MMSVLFERELMRLAADPDVEFLCVREVKGWRVILAKEGEDDQITAFVPDLPGCMSQGSTIEEALKNVEEAIELYLESSDKGTSGT